MAFKDGFRQAVKAQKQQVREKEQAIACKEQKRQDAIASDPQTSRVHLRFPEPVEWVAWDFESGFQVLTLLAKHLSRTSGKVIAISIDDSGDRQLPVSGEVWTHFKGGECRILGVFEAEERHINSPPKSFKFASEIKVGDRVVSYDHGRCGYWRELNNFMEVISRPRFVRKKG